MKVDLRETFLLTGRTVISHLSIDGWRRKLRMPVIRTAKTTRIRMDASRAHKKAVSDVIWLTFDSVTVRYYYRYARTNDAWFS